MRLIILVLLSLSHSIINAAAVNQIFRGTVNMSASSIRVYLCDTVDLNASMLLFSMNIDDATTSGVLVAGRFLDNQTLEFVRDNTNGTAEISYQVIEFSSGVSVQRGVTNVNNTTTNVAISSVNTSRSFAIVTMYNNGSAYGSDDGVTANISSATNLQFSCNAAAFTAFWQVVEYDSCSVQKVISTMGGTSVSSTISSVDLNKTMVFSSHRNSGNVNADDLPRTELSNDTTLVHTRVGSASTLNFISYVVEFTDNTTIQRGSLSFASGDQTLSDTITTVDLRSSALSIPGNFGRQGSTAFTTTDNMGYAWFSATFTNDSIINFERANTGATAIATYEVVSFRLNQTSSFSDANPPGPYDDALVRSIQRGSSTLAIGATTLDVGINAVDLAKSFLVFESSTNDADPGDFNITGTLTSASNIRFERAGTGNLSLINWKVVEFWGDVNVQRGSTTVNAVQVNQAITAVDVRKSFVLLTARGTGNVMGDNDFVTGFLSSPTNILFEIDQPTATVEWQVVEYDDAYVRRIRTSMAEGTTSLNVDINPCGTNYVDPAKTMIVGNHTVDANMRPDDLPRVELSDSTSIDITRVGSTGNLNFVLYVVEFLDSTTVQRGTTTLAGGATSASQAISSVDTTKSIAISTGNLMRQGSSTFSTDDNPGYGNFRLALSSPTSLAVSRAIGGTSTGVAAWQVVSFKRGEEPLPVELLYFKTSLSVASVAELTWATASESGSSHFEIEMAFEE